MASLNEIHVLCLILRDVMCKSETIKAELSDKLGADKLSEYLVSLKEILTTDTKSERAERKGKVYRYEGCEVRDDYPETKDDTEIAGNNANRLGRFGQVVQITGWKDDECVLEIYYDHTLQDVLQPVIEPQTGRLLGFSKAYHDPLCGKSRLRTNLLKWIEDGGQKGWESKHRFESDPEYLAASPRYEFTDPKLWDQLKAKYYRIHPIASSSQPRVDQPEIELSAE